MGKSAQQVYIESVIRIFDRYFLNQSVDGTWVQTQFGKLVPNNLLSLIDDRVLTFHLHYCGVDFSKMNQHSRGSMVDLYIQKILSDASSKEREGFVKIASELVINLYCYGLAFFSAPYEEPQLLKKFIRQLSNRSFAIMNSEFAEHLKTPELSRQYFYALTGRDNPYGFKEFSFTKENSDKLKAFFFRNQSLHLFIIKNYVSILKLIQNFNEFRYNSVKNPLFSFLAEDANYEFTLKLFGEWGANLPGSTDDGTLRLRPFVDFMQHYRQDYPTFIQSRFYQHILLCSRKGVPEGREALLKFLISERMLLKGLISQVENLRVMSACYTSYVGQTGDALSDGRALSSAHHFFMPALPAVSSDIDMDLNEGSSSESEILEEAKRPRLT